jgi:ABC-type bacteriocin/lantibiotic exporter with double-glycine peptidase domain
LDADWLSLQKYSNGDMLNRLNSDMSVVSSNAVSWLPTIVIAVYNFTATFLVLWYYDWIMAVIALTSAPILLLLSKVILKKQRLYSRTVKERGSDLMSFEVETFYGMDTVKSFGLVEHYGEKIRSLQEAFKEASLQFKLFTIGTNAVMSFMGTMVQFLATGYCLFRLWTHTITFGTMTLFLQQRSNLATAFHNLLSIIPSFLNSAVSAHRLRELVELPRELHLQEEKLSEDVLSKGLQVKMSQVTFRYEEGQTVLRNVDFHAAPGEIVALVGPSGEGKTTMLRMILGLIRPKQGQAVIETAEGRALTLNADTRYLFAYVPQGNTIFSGTIADNMRMVKESAADAEIVEALKIACAWDFVQEKENGIYAQVGERGKGLSEGQAQRLAIARAVLMDAPILLLDEATSALDMATERQVLRNIMIQKPHKTCIVTTHRPSVLGLCRRVYRVSEGGLRCLTAEESEQLVKDF